LQAYGAGEQSTNLDGSRSLHTLGNNMKEFPELIQGKGQYYFIEGTGRNLKHRYPNDLADDMWINQDNMPHNGRLKDNAIVIILHHLYMCIEFRDQPSEHNAGAVVEVALVIGLDDLIDAIQWSNHKISTNNIPLWNDCPIHNSGSKGCDILLCPLSDSTLWTVNRHDSAKITNKVCQKYS
jgi:hypothetical protein